MNNKLKTFFMTLGLAFCLSCTNFLDVVPDNTMTIEDMFSTRKYAVQALANAYSYLPQLDATHKSPWLLGDEYMGALMYEENEDLLYPIRLMRVNMQSVTKPIMGLWSGTEGAKALYKGINQANIFIDNIDKVVDLEEVSIKDWKAQVKFLKAYYHFLLVQSYGPIVISDKVISPEETSEEVLFPKRSKIDDCFDYIISLMNEAIPDLQNITPETDLGHVNKSVATAIKARVMVTRARPFFNGNQTLFGDFLDFDGQHFFPQEHKAEKWQEAITAINEAITTCTANGHDIYHYPNTKNMYAYDSVDIAIAPSRMQTLYDLRYAPVDPWNVETIWGYSNLEQWTDYDNYERFREIQIAATPKRPNGTYSGQGDFENAGNVFGAGNWLAASYRMTERYYTKNGLPITEDKTFDPGAMLDIVTTPGITDPGYADIAGIMQPGVQTIKLHLNREIRFYTNLAVAGSYFRSQRYRFKSSMFYQQECGRGIGQRPDECYYATGIGVQKVTHPQSSAGQGFRTIFLPYPIIRMADLYLMKAEALNEFSGPSQEVYDALNVVRRRAGIPDVEVVWANPSLARHPDAHKNQVNLREIILQERSIELAFEGSRYWDVIGYKQAVSEFSKPIRGWNTKGTNAQSFFFTGNVQLRRFTPTNYLWPIPENELNINSNLKQNPGW
ncbi:MAG: RagB/SusD family nutrient uptake outer membrane protein [Prevotellaceae bacterium]|jgi:hypothetical protein|nr:RagB/SusD family nutrient uptake outer membrane protein [Prevotellaceae bacterium]